MLEAKKLYEKDAEHRIHVFIPDTWGNWRWNGSRQKRPLESVVLESNVKDMIVADCKDFINSEEVRRLVLLYSNLLTSPTVVRREGYPVSTRLLALWSTRSVDPF